jgi:hypothetical protein
MTNEEVLLRVKEQKNILNQISKRTVTWSGHVLLRKCLLRQVIHGKIKGRIEVTGKRGRRRRKLLGEFKERREYSHLKEDALDRTVWKARFGRSFGPVVIKLLNEGINVKCLSVFPVPGCDRALRSDRKTYFLLLLCCPSVRNTPGAR